VKTCHIYPVPAAAGAYHWKWRCVEGKRKSTSSRAFELFYDCVEDMRSHGGDIDLEHAHEEIAEAHTKSVAEPARP
jgi:hypothetical protein